MDSRSVKHFARELKAWLKANRLPQVELARRVETDPGTMSRFLSGKTSQINKPFLRVLCIEVERLAVESKVEVPALLKNAS